MLLEAYVDSERMVVEFGLITKHCEILFSETSKQIAPL